MCDYFYFYKISQMLTASFYNINQFKTEKQDIIENFFSILQLGVYQGFLNFFILRPRFKKKNLCDPNMCKLILR